MNDRIKPRDGERIDNDTCPDCFHLFEECVCDNYGYPADWPKCPSCDLPAMDGHITCGRIECNEGARR